MNQLKSTDSLMVATNEFEVIKTSFVGNGIFIMLDKIEIPLRKNLNINGDDINNSMKLCLLVLIWNVKKRQIIIQITPNTFKHIFLSCLRSMSKLTLIYRTTDKKDSSMP